ncbi:hypothetical protein MMC22_011150 [Lobaria immixta]|nr:hypothetical protein [Lobaria immixta]
MPANQPPILTVGYRPSQAWVCLPTAKPKSRGYGHQDRVRVRVQRTENHLLAFFHIAHMHHHRVHLRGLLAGSKSQTIQRPIRSSRRSPSSRFPARCGESETGVIPEPRTLLIAPASQSREIACNRMNRERAAQAHAECGLRSGITIIELRYFVTSRLTNLPSQGKQWDPCSLFYAICARHATRKRGMGAALALG